MVVTTHSWLPVVMVTYGAAAPVNTDDWVKKKIKTLVWTGWAIPMTQSPRHSQMTSGERRENSQRMTLAKAVSSKLNI